MRKPYWPRTLHLTAAHLHARDAYHESLVAKRTAFRTADSYGIVDLEIDEAPSAQGVIALRRLDAIFPSGAIASVEPQAPLRRMVPPDGRDGGHDVHLALPHALERGPNVSFEGGPSRSTRYVARARKDATEVAPMRANLEILFEGEPIDGFETLRLGRIARFGTSLRFQADVLPTALCIRGSVALTAGVRSLVQAMSARRAELVRYRAEHPLRLRAVVASELPGLQLSVALQRHLPLLADMTARRAVHPHELYETLVSLHGSLTAFTHPEIAPPYEHDDQGRAFPWLFERIARLIDRAARDTTTILPFQRVDGATFRLAFEHGELAGKRPMLVLRGPDEEFLRERVPALLKMASPAAIAPLLGSAVRGAAVAVEFEPPDAVPRQEGVVAYRIDLRDRHWLDIEDRRQIQLHLSGAPASLEAFLYGIEQTV